MLDSGFEIQPVDDSIWRPEYGGGGQSYGRFSIDQAAAFGYPACGQYQQGVLDSTTAGYMPVAQTFTWPGGDMYLSALLRGQSQAYPLLVQIPYQVYLFGAQEAFVLADDVVVANPGEWASITGFEADVPAGQYEIKLYGGLTGPENTGLAMFDDVQLSTCPFEGQPCGLYHNTPTPTATGTVNPTPTKTLPPHTYNLLANCDFEFNSRNNMPPHPPFAWRLEQGDPDVEYVTEPGGPVEAHFAMVSNIKNPAKTYGFSQRVEWPIWAGPGAYIKAWCVGDCRIAVLDDDSGYQWVKDFYKPSWGLVEWWISSTDFGGAYWVYVETATDGANTKVAGFDGVYFGNEPDGGCSPTNEDQTPTPGATQTAAASYTPVKTATAPFATNTPRPPRITDTPGPTSTGTPYTETPTITPTPGGGNTQPPASACDYGCVIPAFPNFTLDLGEWFGRLIDYLSAWLNYVACAITKYLAWCPDNTAQVLGWQGLASDREPFRTISELIESVTIMQEAVNNFSGTYAPITGMDTEPNYSMFTEPDMPDARDTFDFMRDMGRTVDAPANTECSAAIAAVGYYEVGQGMCWFFNLLDELNVLWVFQALANIMSLMIIALYVRKYKDQVAV